MIGCKVDMHLHVACSSMVFHPVETLVLHMFKCCTVLGRSLLTELGFQAETYIHNYCLLHACSKDFDAALIVLKEPIRMPPITLAATDSCFNVTKDDCELQHFGWKMGYEAPGFQAASTTGISQDSCTEIFERLQIHTLTRNMLCAGKLISSTYICHSDPGAPLVLDGEQVGIASWSIGCADDAKPGVYTSIPKLLSWITREVDSVHEVSTMHAFKVYSYVVPGKGSCCVCLLHGIKHLSPASYQISTVHLPTTVLILQGPNCSCSADGFSGGIETGRSGCKQHLLENGDNGFFCMVDGGSECTLATSSLEYEGAAWRVCE